MKKNLVGIVISMLLFATVFSVAVTANDNWSMYGHDAQHTRYSTSIAPFEYYPLWDAETGDTITSSPAIVDGKVYVGSYDFNVYCFDAETGDEIWYFETEDSVGSSPAVADGIVYVYSNDGYLYYLDAEDGSFLDSYFIGGSTPSSPTVINEKVFIGSEIGNVYCFSSEGAIELWNVSLGSIIISAQSVVDDSVFATSTDGSVYCLDADDGSVIWTHSIGGLIFSTPAVVDDKVYLGSMSNPAVYCLDAIGNGDGTTDMLWSYPVVGSVQSSPAVADGKVFVNSKSYMYGLDADSGEEQWNRSVGDSLMYSSSPAVADGMVYFCSGTIFGTIFCLDTENGDLIWSHDINDGIKSSPAIADGKLFFGSQDNSLYCIGIEQKFPELNIQSIEGGNQIYATIRNDGEAYATNVNWTIVVDGGLFILRKEGSGSMEVLAPGLEIEITILPFGIGLGIFTPMPTITVTVDCAEDSSDEESVSARILFAKVTLQ